VDNAAEENWHVLLSLLPAGWERLAFRARAVERLRGFPTAEAVLRTLLLHVGKGLSLRETAMQAKLGGIAAVSDVTILNRLRQAERWLHRLCQELAEENGLTFPAPPAGRNVRLLDGTVVKEPGRTGSGWRIHYSLQIPTLCCDHLEVTSVRGSGTGEKLQRFPARIGDLVLADRGFCKPAGIDALRRQGADVIVRVNTGSLRLRRADGKPFELLKRLRAVVTEADQIRDWEVVLPTPTGAVAGRICAVRKSETAIARALRRIRRKTQQGGPKVKPATLEYARYVIVFTTLDATEFPAARVLEWYRLRWQIELVFKRLKSLAGTGHLPKHEDASSRAWLYGKLLVALLTQKLIQIGRAISPWGYPLRAETR
jgi:hypothetical protein